MFQPIRLLDQGCWYRSTFWKANSADPDQLAYRKQAGYIRIWQDKGLDTWHDFDSQFWLFFFWAILFL